MTATPDQPAYVLLKRQRDDGGTDVFEANLSRTRKNLWQICLEGGTGGAGGINYSESDYPTYAAAKQSFLARCSDRLRRGYALVQLLPKGWENLDSNNKDLAQ